MQSIYNFFQKIEDEEGTLNSLWCYHFPVPKSEIFSGNYRSIYLMIMSTKILNKILENQSRNTIDLIICECHFCEFVYLLKFVWNLRISACAFTVICRHVQHGEQSEPSEAHVPS